MLIKVLKYLLIYSLVLVSFTGCTKKNELPTQTSSDVLDASVFQYTPPEVTEVPDEVEPSNEVKTVSLFIQPCYRLDIDLPVDVTYITDNYTYVYATNSSWSIQVLSNINKDNLSKETGVLNPVTLSSTVVRSEQGFKAPQQVAKYLVDGKSVVISCYNQPEVFSTAMNSLLNYELVELTPKPIYDSVISGMELSALPDITDVDNVTVTQDMTDIYSKQYLYTKGSLVISKEIRKKTDVEDLLSMRLAVTIPGAVADEYYRSDNLLYVRYGDYTIAALSVNYNTTISLWAIGDIGRDNLIAFIRGELNG